MTNIIDKCRNPRSNYYVQDKYPSKKDFTHEETTSITKKKLTYLDEEGYKEAIKQHRHKDHECFCNFRNDVIEEFNLIDKRIGDVIFNEAWDKSHSEGFEAVYNKFADLVNFIDSVNNAK